MLSILAYSKIPDKQAKHNPWISSEDKYQPTQDKFQRDFYEISLEEIAWRWSVVEAYEEKHKKTKMKYHHVIQIQHRHEKIKLYF